jgi:hypothetical protein
MLKPPITSLLVVSFVLLAGYQARAGEPQFGTVTVGAPFFGASDPALPGSSQPTVHVSYASGTWTAIAPGNLPLPIAYEARMKKGYIVNAKFGRPDRGESVTPIIPEVGEPNPNQADTAIAGLATVPMRTEDLLPDERAQIVAACASHANEANGFQATHNFLVGFQVDAQRRRRWTVNGYVAFGNSARKMVTGVIPLRVICEPPPDHVTVPLKVTGAELYLTTFKGDGAVPAQGASCKILKVTARFKTTTSGLVHFDLSHQVGDQGIKTIPITIEAKQKSDGTYAAEYVKDWFFDKKTYAQFFVQETDGQGVSAGWKDINVTCDNNFADPASHSRADEPAVKVSLSAIPPRRRAGSATCTPAGSALCTAFETGCGFVGGGLSSSPDGGVTCSIAKSKAVGFLQRLKARSGSARAEVSNCKSDGSKDGDAICSAFGTACSKLGCGPSSEPDGSVTCTC